MYIKAEQLEAPESRKALAEEMQADIRKSKKHFKRDFDRMIEDMNMCMLGRSKDWDDNCYKVNITQRFVRQKVASLYAKNPQAVAKRKPRMVYQLWNGDSQAIQTANQQIEMAMQVAQEAGVEPDIPPEAQALLQDIAEGNAKNKLIDRVGKTMELLYRYYMDEQIPSFKSQMKKCVRSSVQTAVGYLKIGFQRDMDLAPENKAKIADFAQRIAHIERLQNDLDDKENPVDDSSAEIEELENSIASLEAAGEVIIREGLVFDFPKPLSIIPDSSCTSLKGWIDADWLAEEIFLTCDEIKEFFNLDLGAEGSSYTKYSTRGADYSRNPRTDLDGTDDELVCCWVLWHKPSGMKYTLADGYADFLEEPEPPEVTLERFFPIYALCYNEIEHPTRLFPPSDVHLMRDQQMELNRSKESVREHRIANRPGYAFPRGALSEEDKELLGSHPPNAAIEIDGLIPGQKVADMFQALPKIGVDPNLYETAGVMNDVYLTVGASEATFGQTSGATATESSIAEANRTGALEAEIDELNDFLTEVARDAGQVMLAELDKETVEDLVGVGAAWPTLSQESIQKEVYLSVVAGSNGRPNKAQKQQAIQQIAPFLLQIPGINPEWMAKMMIQAVDDSIDLTEAISEQVPSIMTMNNHAQATGAMQDPNAQGQEGGNNAQLPAQPSQGSGPQGNRDRPMTSG